MSHQRRSRNQLKRDQVWPKWTVAWQNGGDGNTTLFASATDIISARRVCPIIQIFTMRITTSTPFLSLGHQTYVCRFAYKVVFPCLVQIQSHNIKDCQVKNHKKSYLLWLLRSFIPLERGFMLSTGSHKSDSLTFFSDAVPVKSGAVITRVISQVCPLFLQLAYFLDIFLSMRHWPPRYHPLIIAIPDNNRIVIEVNHNWLNKWF